MAFLDESGLTWLLTKLKEKFQEKVSVADIKNDLTSSDPDRPLAAAQGKALKQTLDSLTLASLAGDAQHRVVTDEEKAAWNGKSDFSGSYEDLTGKPDFPSVDAQLSATSTHAVQNKIVKAALDKKVTKDDSGWLSYTMSLGTPVEYRIKNDVVFLRGYSDNTVTLTANQWTEVGYIPSGNWPSEGGWYFTANGFLDDRVISGYVSAEDGYIRLYATTAVSNWSFGTAYPLT